MMAMTLWVDGDKVAMLRGVSRADMIGYADKCARDKLDFKIRTQKDDILARLATPADILRYLRSGPKPTVHVDVPELKFRRQYTARVSIHFPRKDLHLVGVSVK